MIIIIIITIVIIIITIVVIIIIIIAVIIIIRQGIRLIQQHRHVSSSSSRQGLTSCMKMNVLKRRLLTAWLCIV